MQGQERALLGKSLLINREQKAQELIDELIAKYPKLKSNRQFLDVIYEVLKGTSSFGTRSLFVAAQYAGNGLIMSHLGDDAAAASTVTTAGVAFFMGMMSGFLAATGVDLGKAIKKKDNREIGNIIKTGWVMTGILGVIAAGGFLSTRAFLPLFLDDKVAKAASDLFSGYAVAATTELVVWGNGQIPFKIEKNNIIPFATAAAYRLSALGLSYWFAKVLGMGPLGIGLGAAASGVFNVAAFQAWYSRAVYHPFNLYDFKIDDFKEHVREFLSTGWPVSLQRVSEWLNLFLISQVTGAWSDHSLLAEQASLSLLVASGFMSQGSGQYSMMQVTEDRKARRMLLDDFVKTGNEEKLLEAYHLQKKNKHHFSVSIINGIVLNAALAGAIYAGRHGLIQLYAPENEVDSVMDLATLLLTINAISLPFDSTRNITAGILRGWDDMIYPTLVSLILMTVVAVPLGAALGFALEDSVLPMFIARLVTLAIAGLINVRKYYQHDAEDDAEFNEILLNQKILKSINQAVSNSGARYLEIEARLIEQARAFGFELEDVPGDGNCFFDAISKSLNSSEFDPVALRRLVARHISEYATSYEGFVEDDFDQFLARISQDGEWADHLLIQALSRELNVNIVLLRSDQAEPTIIKQSDADRTLYLGYQVGWHFQSLSGEPSRALLEKIEGAEVDHFERLEEVVINRSDTELNFLGASGEIPSSAVLFLTPAAGSAASDALNHGHH